MLKLMGKSNVFGLVVWLMILSVSANEYGRVHLRTTAGDNVQVGENGRFKITLFADLHFGEDAWTPWGPRQDANSLQLMSTILDRELPDFVIYLGDVITANNIPVQNASLYWDKAISPTRDRGIPFTTIFGNHDDAPFEWPLEWFSSPGIPEHHCSTINISHPGYTEGKSCSFRGTTRLELVSGEIQRNSFSYSKSGPSILWPSVSNYVIKISSSSNAELPMAFMYFLDSGGGSYPEVLSSAQADWFKQKSQEVNPNSRIPEIIFWHIPSKAYKKVAPGWFFKGKCVGSMFKESVAAQEEETGIMKLLEARPSVKAVFVGHNHGLDWCCPHKKLWLCYARHSGYGGYGNWPRGARILEIIEKPLSLESWIRMEDGTSHSKVVLSS